MLPSRRPKNAQLGEGKENVIANGDQNRTFTIKAIRRSYVSKRLKYFWNMVLDCTDIIRAEIYCQCHCFNFNYEGPIRLQIQ